MRTKKELEDCLELQKKILERDRDCTDGLIAAQGITVLEWVLELDTEQSGWVQKALERVQSQAHKHA